MNAKRGVQLGGAVAAVAALSWTRPAHADEAVIKFPGQHPNYIFEAEPHFLVDPFNDFAPGVGFRGTVVVLQNGFVKTINNSIGVTFGLDYAHQGVWIPVAMQWNFWLSRHWSVFGEPGVTFRAGDRNDHVAWLGLWAGGRYHFTDRITLTLRVGSPTLSAGVSFLL